MKIVITEYKNLTRWDVKAYLSTLKSIFGVEKIGKYIYEHSEKIKLFEYSEQEFPILGVTNKEGVYLNLYEKGKNIHQPYKKVLKDELFYNPYRINIGSIGIVPDKYDSFYTSPAYVVFGVKEGLINEYLYLILKSNWYNVFLRAATSGSVRQNLTYELLSSLKIPIPNISIQQKIVSFWNNTLKKAEELKKQVIEKEKYIETFLLNELGIEKKEYKKTKDCFIIEFKDLERWSVKFNNKKNILKSKYKLVLFKELFKSLKNGFDYRKYSETGIKYIRVQNIKNNSISNFKIKKISNIDNKHFLKNCQLLITRKGTVGQSCIWKSKDNENYVASSEIFIIDLDENKIYSEYFSIVNLSSFLQEQYEEKSGGTIMKSISQDNLKSLLIPLPSIEKQKEIVEKIDSIRSEIKIISEKAEKIIENTKKEIENILLGRRK